MIIRLTFPKPGLRNPETNEVHEFDEHVITRTIGDNHYRGHRFEYDWELVPGIWTFEIRYGQQKMIEQSFTVTK